MSINPRAHAGRKPPRGRSRAHRVLGRHDDAGFDEDELGAFLLGVRVHIFSSWILYAQYDVDTGWLTLTTYDEKDPSALKDYRWALTYDEAVDFAVAPSKGGFYHDRLKSR